MGFYSPTVWDNLLNSDRAAWDSVKDEDVIEESRGTCDRYSECLMEQAFYGLYDPLAELSPVPPEGLEAESGLLHRAMEMDEYLSLRDEVYSDRMASMLATAAFSKELLERLPEDVKKDMEENRQAAQEAKEAQEKDPSDPAAREAAERARQALETLKQSMGRNQAQIENAAATAMENTGKELRDGKKMLSNLGFSPEGGRLTRTDVENMRYLAELLRNNERLRRMIELIGTMERIVSDEKKKSVYGREQLVDYRRKELDLEDLAPEEFTGLGAPEGSALHTDFMIRLANSELLHCRYEGESPEGRGPVIILKDTSGSMEGERLEFANALEFAVNQKTGRNYRNRRKMTPRILFNETEMPDMCAGCSSFEMMDLLYSKAEDFYASIPDVEYEEPVIAIAEISDGCGNVMPACWELSGHMLSACFEPIDSYHEFYIDQGGDLHSTGIDLRNGTSSYLFRVFKSDICRDEQQWLIDLINSSNELGDDIREEIDRCTLPVGIDFETAGIV